MESYKPLKVTSMKCVTPTYTYARIVSKNPKLKYDLAHKLISAILVSFFYAFYMSYWETFTVHKYMTINGLLMTVVTRWGTLLHFLIESPDRSRLTTWVNRLQTANFAIEGTIFLFYWTVIAAYDYGEGHWDGYVHAYNIFNHVGAFIFTAVPVLIERTRFRHRHFYLFTVPLITAYLVFVFIYNTSGREPVYRVLTFDNIYSIRFVIGSVSISAAMFYLGYFISRHNENKHRKFRSLKPLPKLAMYFKCLMKKKVMDQQTNKITKTNSY